jgi:hypothetical protein
VFVVPHWLVTTTLISVVEPAAPRVTAAGDVKPFIATDAVESFTVAVTTTEEDVWGTSTV